MAWSRDKDGVDPDSLRTPHLFPIPARVAVPMEEREARANRFVSQQVEPTEKLVPSKPSSKLRHWLRRVRQEERERLHLQ